MDDEELIGWKGVRCRCSSILRSGKEKERRRRAGFARRVLAAGRKMVVRRAQRRNGVVQLEYRCTNKVNIHCDSLPKKNQSTLSLATSSKLPLSALPLLSQLVLPKRRPRQRCISLPSSPRPTRILSQVRPILFPSSLAALRLSLGSLRSSGNNELDDPSPFPFSFPSS